MKKYLVLFISLLVTCFVMLSCSQNVKFDNTNENVKVVETLQKDFKLSLKSAIADMQEEARPLLNSIVFNEQESSVAIKKGGNYGTYDYKSCMNYDGCYYVKGTNILISFDDIKEISHNDILTVKNIYSRISYKEMIDNWQDTRSILLKEY